MPRPNRFWQTVRRGGRGVVLVSGTSTTTAAGW
jgi:hypothetical protein